MDPLIIVFAYGIQIARARRPLGPPATVTR
jgi:hypothetical protein